MFPMQITLTIHSLAQLQALAELGAEPRTGSGVTAGSDKPAKVEKPVETKPAKPETAKPVEAKRDGTTDDTAAVQAQLDAKTYTMDEAKSFTTKAVAKGNRPAMEALLAKFGVKKTAELKADQVNAFCTEAEALAK